MSGPGAVKRARNRLWPRAAQEQRLASMSLVDSLGTGLFIATVPVFLVSHQGIDASRVGWALSAAGLALLVVSLPAGLLADAVPLRVLYTIGSLVQAAASVLMATAPSLAMVTLALVVANVGAGLVAPPRSVIVARAAPPDDLVRVRAYNRAVFQVGMAVGAGLAALVIWADQTALYAAGFLINAVTFVVNSMLVRFVHEYQAEPPVGESPAQALAPGANDGYGGSHDSATRWRVYRDVPFLLAAGVNALLFFIAVLVDPVVAVFISASEHAATVLVPILLALNMVVTVAVQVPLSRGCVGAAGVRRAQRRAGLAALGGCALFAVSDLVRPVGLVVAALLAGMVVLTLAETWISAASWEASFRLAPRAAQGQYFSTFNLGPGLAQAFGPGLLTAVVLADHGVGWLIAGATLCLVGVIGASVSSRAIEGRLSAPPVAP